MARRTRRRGRNRATAEGTNKSRRKRLSEDDETSGDYLSRSRETLATNNSNSNNKSSTNDESSPLLLTPLCESPEQGSHPKQQEQQQQKSLQQQQRQVLPVQDCLSLTLNQPVYALREFIRNHAPALELNVDHSSSGNRGESSSTNGSRNSSSSSNNNKKNLSLPPELEKMLIAPLSSIPALTHVKQAECREPVSSLMDDVVWALVQRQERGKRRIQQEKQHQRRSRNGCRTRPAHHRHGNTSTASALADATGIEEDFRNVLIQGYTTARAGETAPRGMRPGIALVSHMHHPKLTSSSSAATTTGATNAGDGIDSHYHQRLKVSSFSINEHLAYCKSSSVFQFLHMLVGDEILRIIMMHTRIFLPLPVTQQHLRAKHGNPSHLKRRRKNEDGDNSSNCQNYLLLCGPPLPSISANYDKVGSKPGCNKSHGRKRKCTSSELNDTQNHRKKRRSRRYRHTPTCDTTQQSTNGSISRFPLLYFDAYVPKIGLPRSHVLQKIRMRQIYGATTITRTTPRTTSTPKPLSRLHSSGAAQTKSDINLLLNTMLGLWRESKNRQRRIRRRIGSDGMELCTRILGGHSKCDYQRLLKRYCPLPLLLRRPGATKICSSNDKLMHLAHAHTCKDGIVWFLRRVLQQVFPLEFWGSSGNFKAFMTSVENFVHLRRRERLTNKCLMHGIRVTKVKWLMSGNDVSPAVHTPWSSHDVVTSLTLTVLRWVFQGFIIPLLRSIFYVTETEFSGQELQYYRKPVWSLFRSLSIKKLVKGNHFHALSFHETLSRLRNHKQMGLSRLRLLPKSTGLRPINQLSRRQSLRFLFQHAPVNVPNLVTNEISERLPANVILKKILDVLRYETSQRETSFGVGMDSLEMFYARYRDYITETRRKFGCKMNLFAASVDIEKCYDRINQRVLLDLLNKLISNAAYFVQHIRSDHFADGQSINVGNEGAKVHFTRVVAPMDTYEPLHQTQQDRGKNANNTIFHVSKCTLTEQAEIVELLKEHLSNQIVVVSGRFQSKVLLQCTGIAQGSVLSTTLCNLYYGHIEQLMFREQSEGSVVFTRKVRNTSDQSALNKSSDLMARFVDDFLFLSPHKEAVGEFLVRSYKGLPHLGVEVNREKTMVSADIAITCDGPTSTTTHSSAPAHHRRNRWKHPVFPWCGLLFDLTTGEVSMDYERFRSGRLRDSLTVDTNGSEGLRLNTRMKSFALPRCLPILFDGVINSPTTIAGNFHEMMLLSAAKTVEYLRSQEKLVAGGRQNPPFVRRCIEELGKYAWQNIDRNLRRLRRNRSKSNRTRDHGFYLDLEQSRWLTWKAFTDVFSATDDFDHLVSMLWKTEPLFHQCSKDLPLNHIAASTFDHFQLKHFIRRLRTAKRRG